jgi:hypothetical protein
MRRKLKYRRRLRNSASYVLEKQSRSKVRGTRAGRTRLTRPKSRATAKAA